MKGFPSDSGVPDVRHAAMQRFSEPAILPRAANSITHEPVSEVLLPAYAPRDEIRNALFCFPGLELFRRPFIRLQVLKEPLEAHHDIGAGRGCHRREVRSARLLVLFEGMSPTQRVEEVLV